MQNRQPGSAEKIHSSLGIDIAQANKTKSVESTPAATPATKPSLYLNTSSPAVSTLVASSFSPSPMYGKLNSRPATRPTSPCDAIIVATPTPRA